jgi:hypothetical protein
MNQHYNGPTQAELEPDEPETDDANPRYPHCRCGNPDWPGTCPGWQQCPLWDEDADE